jgi:hypothetical protein
MGILRSFGVAAALLGAMTTLPDTRSVISEGESAGLSLSAPGRANAYPSTAAKGGFVVVAWAATAPDGPTDVYSAVSRDAGRRFDAPVRVNDVPGDARISGEQPPRVSLVPGTGRDAAIVIVWTSKGSQGSRLLYARSDDGGRTYGRATAVPGSSAPGDRGWQSLALDGRGHVVAAWLDHRALASGTASAAPMAHHEGQAHAAGDSSASVSRAQLSKLYVAPLNGSDADARVVAGGVCYCCKTAFASGPDGALYAAWRHVYPGNIRDIAFTLSRDGGRTFAPPVRVSEDQWVLDGCPENGPAAAVDAKGRIHVVWPTLVQGRMPDAEPTLALFHAVSTDGRQFSPRQRIPSDGTVRHPQIAALADGTLAIAWDETVNGTRTIALARAAIGADGVARIDRIASHDPRTGTYPSLVVSDRVLLAWTSQDAPATIRLESVEAFDRALEKRSAAQ